MPGSLDIELVLWLCFLLPGILYSIWRLSGRKRACPTCRGSSMIPVDSPKGRELCQMFGIDPATVPEPETFSRALGRKVGRILRD